MKRRNRQVIAHRQVPLEPNIVRNTRPIRRSTPYTQQLEREVALRAEQISAIQRGKKISDEFLIVGEILNDIRIRRVVTDVRLARDYQLFADKILKILRHLAKQGHLTLEKGNRGQWIATAVTSSPV